MKILELRELPGLARLYLADLPGEAGRSVEFVDTVEPGVAKEEKWVLMISTQLGCPVACRMCDAGAMGFHGNLSAEEMLAQVRRVLADNPELDPASHPKLKIHFARMGEPALNPAVLEALERLAAELPYGGLMPSLSTVAPASPQAADFLERLIAVKNAHYGGGRFQLQFSLHSMDAAARARIVPVPVWSPEEIAAYGARFAAHGDRRITLNFALARGERLDTARIKEVFDPALFLVKVTPVNPTYTASLNGSSYVWNNPPEGLFGDAAELQQAGFKVILSPSAPEEVQAETSCGQLWASSLKRKAALAGRGRERELPFDWGRAALLVVDMQEFFTCPAGPAHMPQALPALEKAAALAAAFRAAGRPVLFTSHAHRDPGKDGGLMTRRWSKVCLHGSPWAEISPCLAARRGEVFEKQRYSAFTSRALARRMKALGADSLVIAGLKTDLCVESTVREAFDRDYSCVVAGDACAARTPEAHAASLAAVRAGFGAVRSSAEVICALNAAAEGRPAGEEALAV